MDFKDIIRLKRNEMGLSSDELGKLVGVGRSTIYKYEQGVLTNPPLGLMKKLSDVLNIDPVLFFELDTEAEDESSEKAKGLFKQLDDCDKAEIIGEMKGMLKNDKYRKEKGSLAAG